MGTTVEEMRTLVARHCVEESTIPRIDGLELRLGRARTPPLPTMYPTMVCFVLQGTKRVTFGDRTLSYHGESFMLMAVDLPATGQVVEATSDAPYLAVSMLLDPGSVAELLVELPPAARISQGPGFTIGALTPDLQDPLCRLLRLLETPVDIPVLAPLLKRELLYRLLQGPQGRLLRDLALRDSRLSLVRRAIASVRTDMARPLRIDSLAAGVGMSASSLHRHFKAATGLSPLQYQKHLRLQEARRRLLVEGSDVTTVALEVGYESASQFSREYVRLFGLPPAKDAARRRVSPPSAANIAGNGGGVTRPGVRRQR